jgi:hypothetical protein
MERSFNYLSEELTKKIRIGLVCYKDVNEKNEWESLDLDQDLEKFN